MYTNLILCSIIAAISALLTFVVHFFADINIVMFFCKAYMCIDLARWFFVLAINYYGLKKWDLDEEETEEFTSVNEEIIIYLAIKFALIGLLIIINSDNPFSLAYFYSSFLIALIIAIRNLQDDESEDEN